uniref:Uncharacterized protein n=1 Tax=Cacopsylla melanoneura TaxID=428564 RepID=A0A8D9BF88_9HEMI
MKSDNDGTGNPAHRYHEYGPNRTNEHTTRTNARYASVLSESATNILVNPSSKTNNYESNRRHSILDDHHPPRKCSIDHNQQFLSQHPTMLMQGSHQGRGGGSSKPQLHIFMPRFQNVS